MTARNRAPELRVEHWIDAQGAPRQPLTLADLGSGYKVIYCFQHWCEGCHASGFPSLQKMVAALAGRGFGFAVVQTVFEGAEVNTPERLRETQLRYGLEIPFGHDGAADSYPATMIDYRTGGTPWFILIDPEGNIIHSDFRMNAEAVIEFANSRKSK